MCCNATAYPQLLCIVEKFKHPGAFFTRKGAMEKEIDRQMREVSPAKQTPFQFVVVKREWC